MNLTSSRSTLASSLKDFTRSSSIAIKRLYAGPRRERGIYEDCEGVSDSEEISPAWDEVGEGPNETVFLLYL